MPRSRRGGTRAMLSPQRPAPPPHRNDRGLGVTIGGMSSQPAVPDKQVEHQHTDKGYVPVYTTAVVEQPWASYTAVDHNVWAQLFDRQRALLVGRASDE